MTIILDKKREEIPRWLTVDREAWQFDRRRRTEGTHSLVSLVRTSWEPIRL